MLTAMVNHIREVAVKLQRTNQVIIVEVPPEIHGALKKLAADRRTTMSSIIRGLIKHEIVRDLGERALREAS